MNGLTAADVRNLTGAISQSADRYRASGKKEIAGALDDLLYAINEMQRYNTTQASRPDRVGDECWYALWDVDNGRWDWRRGIFRGICDRSYPFVAEDAITKSLELCLHVNFSAEAPK